MWEDAEQTIRERTQTAENKGFSLASPTATPCHLRHGVAKTIVGRANMKKIKARVNTRFLAKADRLFTGTVEGRVIEILQNARLAGATKVGITNEAGIVTVRDNGKGIEDSAKLLDLGDSGWDETLEQSEDPAGVGLFCLAGREGTTRSKGTRVTIGKDGWLGKATTNCPTRTSCGRRSLGLSGQRRRQRTTSGFWREISRSLWL